MNDEKTQRLLAEIKALIEKSEEARTPFETAVEKYNQKACPNCRQNKNRKEVERVSTLKAGINPTFTPLVSAFTCC